MQYLIHCLSQPWDKHFQELKNKAHSPPKKQIQLGINFCLQLHSCATPLSSGQGLALSHEFGLLGTKLALNLCRVDAWNVCHCGMGPAWLRLTLLRTELRQWCPFGASPWEAFMLGTEIQLGMGLITLSQIECLCVCERGRNRWRNG